MAAKRIVISEPDDEGNPTTLECGPLVDPDLTVLQADIGQGLTPRNTLITWKHPLTLGLTGKPATTQDKAVKVNWADRSKRISISSPGGEVREVMTKATVTTVEPMAIDDILLRAGVPHIVLEVQEVKDADEAVIERHAYV
jgi:hypothetical protein